ncbi:hypothetical protein ACOJUR_00040 [Alicyclobacillus tolerans]|uniref:hypothetical protein n=1 Tax=Alicyclobacillus tolerans TaxID=90970 RepID=UPI003B775466
MLQMNANDENAEKPKIKILFLFFVKRGGKTAPLSNIKSMKKRRPFNFSCRFKKIQKGVFLNVH